MNGTITKTENGTKRNKSAAVRRNFKEKNEKIFIKLTSEKVQTDRHSLLKRHQL